MKKIAVAIFALCCIYTLCRAQNTAVQIDQIMNAPRSTHYAAVPRIIRYIKGTMFHGLHYSVTSPLILRAYPDADWAGDPSDRRSSFSHL